MTAPEPRPWPNPADSALDRARRIVTMYRTYLAQLDPTAAAAVDATCASYGETWMLETPDLIDPDQQLTTAEAAELARVPAARIRTWACTPHPEKPGQMLLPRFERRGREQTYIAIHVLAAASLMRRRRNIRT